MSLNEDKLKQYPQYIRKINEIIAGFMPKEDGYQEILFQAMNYSIEAGGKRIRPLLIREAYRLFSDQNEAVIYPLIAAVEMIHTYSLTHDDLPAMDNDEYRRGRKTTHIAFGEAIAILAGDGLLNLAMETALKVLETDDKQVIALGIKALKVLYEKAGAGGMIGGQAADILAEAGTLPQTEELLYFIHGKKTAALIEAAMMIGGILAGADEESIKKLEKAGYNIGIAFQFQDDILDITGSFDELGKPIGSDDEKQKLTSVSLKGLSEAKAEVSRLSREAIEILSSFPRRNDFLLELVDSLIYRKK
ncbi:MAG: polyprenyl synthetase family protein [Lachnospiraceae bacterium]|nr:polyprenyl synthetase family protein [Lachnospiraceae bacterium]